MAQLQLRWSGNIEAQRQADEAYFRLKPKPKVQKQAKPKKRRARFRREEQMSDLDREYYDLVRSF